MSSTPPVVTVTLDDVEAMMNVISAIDPETICSPDQATQDAARAVIYKVRTAWAHADSDGRITIRVVR